MADYGALGAPNSNPNERSPKTALILNGRSRCGRIHSMLGIVLWGTYPALAYSRRHNASNHMRGYRPHGLRSLRARPSALCTSFLCFVRVRTLSLALCFPFPHTRILSLCAIEMHIIFVSHGLIHFASRMRNMHFFSCLWFLSSLFLLSTYIPFIYLFL